MTEPSTEHAQAEVHRLTKDYTAILPQARLARLTLAAGSLSSLLDREDQPARLRDLHSLAARLGVLLAYTHQDLGHTKAGARHARLAAGHAGLAGHDELRVHARTVQANIVFWDGEPAAALGLVEPELPAAPAARRAPLLYNEARSLAALDDRAGALRALAEAQAAIDLAPADALWGGTSFEWRPASGLLLAASTHARLGNGAEAAELAERCLTAYQSRPRGEKPSNADIRALLELAAARVLTEDLDAAEEALRPVIALDPARRAERLVRRVEFVQQTVARSRFAETRQARALTELAQEFVRTALRHSAQQR
jgi:tetratricopeptide (TPR) repeat protein